MQRACESGFPDTFQFAVEPQTRVDPFPLSRRLDGGNALVVLAVGGLVLILARYAILFRDYLGRDARPWGQPDRLPVSKRLDVGGIQ